ncbi:hypothetical protein PGTUg99_031586 [Puccinia graminis f. sp. tritici]|uniref:Uncharacterized protein n=1 Tax=Puccinia graminis f. sp. tritici TaxID=56615 RepID=A0A5B0SLY1_PUCGR|nr:hypothetical protein PGTUg99_031586 [Puccinia graminis f. sp. tritici]
MNMNIAIPILINVLLNHLLAMDPPGNGNIQILDGISVQVIDATSKSPTPPPPCAHCRKHGHNEDECWLKHTKPGNPLAH